MNKCVNWLKKIIIQVRILINRYQNYKKKVFVRNFILYHVTDEILHPYDETNPKEGLQAVVELQIWHLFGFRNILMKTKVIICNFSNILSFVLIGLQLCSIWLWLCISLMFSPSTLCINWILRIVSAKNYHKLKQLIPYF